MTNVNIDDQIYNELKQVYPYAQIRALVNFILRQQLDREKQYRKVSK